MASCQWSRNSRQDASTDDAERDEFDRAAARLDDADPAPGGVWGAPGWVAIVTAEELHHVADLPVQGRAVIVAVVESRGTTLYRDAWDKLEELEELEELAAPLEDIPGVERITGPASSAASVPAARPRSSRTPLPGHALQGRA
jgi:hypothetical protein